MVELKPFLDTITEFISNEDHRRIRSHLLTPEDWLEVQSLISILRPFNKYSKKLQSKNSGLSDFYGYWTSIKLAMEKLSQDELVRCIIDEMNKREQTLLENPVVTSAVYLDPRYQRVLSQDKKQMAIFFLSNLYIRVQQLKENNENNEEAETTENAEANRSNVSNESNLSANLEEYLDNLMPRENVVTTSMDDLKAKIEQQLKNFDGTNISSRLSVLDYWKQEKENKTELYELASVIYTVQATQTSVERAFSIFNLTYTQRRTKLSDENLQNTLIVKLNEF